MNKSRKYIFIAIIILFVLLTPIIIFFISTKQKSEIEKKIVNYVISAVPVKETKKESLLEKIVTDNFGNNTNYSAVIKNFKTNEEYKFNEDKEFNSASLYKLWVFAVAMQAIEDGELDPEETVSGDKNKFDETLGLITPEPTSENAPEENVEIEPVYISMKVSDAIQKMITESDNYAALLLTQKLGYRNIDNFLKEYEFKDSSFGNPPKSTAADIARYYELLYNGEIIDKKKSDEMIEILKDQTLDDRIPKYLPEEVLVAHKKGELFGAKHDEGIVYTKSGDYMIIVLSQTENEAVAAEEIAKFSEGVFNYFTSEN